MSEEQKISAVITYEKLSENFDVILFDNPVEARNCYLNKTKTELEKSVSVKYHLPVHQKFIDCPLTDIKLGDEVAVVPGYQKATIFGIVVDIDEAEGTFDVLVRKDCKDRDRPSVRTFVLNSNSLVVLKTGNSLYSIASYVQ